LFYFYQILTAFNNLKILSELVLLLPNTDSFQQFEDFVRACSTFTKYWQLFWQKSQFFLSGQYLLEVEEAQTKILKLLKAVSIQ
jgi:hypothetical protein